MSISSSTRKAGPFTGNDVTTVFPFAFKVFSAADLLVVHTDLLGVEHDLVLNSDYTVSLNANQDNNPGGSVTLSEALPEDELLTLTSAVGALQQLTLTNAGGFYPAVINGALDRLTIIAQQILEQVGRSLKLPISSTADPTLPAPAPNELIAWNGSGDGFVNVPVGDLVTVAGYADARIETFTGDGVETEFEIDFHPGVLANLDISLGGVTQVGGVDFDFVGTTVVFSSAPPDGVTVLVRYARPIAPVPDFDEVLSSVEDAQAAAAAAAASAAAAGNKLDKGQALSDLDDVLAATVNLKVQQTGSGAVEESLRTAVTKTIYASSYGMAAGASAAVNTAALQNAVNEAHSRNGGQVLLPPGVCNVNTVNLRPNVQILGASLGSNDTVLSTTRGSVLVQNDPDEPVIHVLSDATWGVQRGVRLKDFILLGHASATVRMLRFEAITPYAITECVVDVDSFGGFGLYEAVTGGANTVYLCSFKMKANTCTSKPFVTYGAYNQYDLRVNYVPADEYACTINDTSASGRIVCDGPVSLLGTSCVLGVAVESVHSAPASPWEAAIGVYGSNNTLVAPHIVNVQAARATASIRVYGGGTTIVNPVVSGSDYPAYPFDITGLDGPCTIVGGSMLKTFSLEAYASDADLARLYTAGNSSSYYTPKSKGATANRPGGLGASHVGRLYLDTDLDADGKPVWWNGSAWVDATGATV